MKLEIGGGSKCEAGWVNLDPSYLGTEGWQFRAQDREWPTAHGTVKAIRASHVMEHIPAGEPRIHVFNEAHRVLEVGGTFEVIVPLIMTGEPGNPLPWQAIADPTHVSFWVPESFHYFDGTFAANADYGIHLWTTVTWEIHSGWEGRWVGTPA